jgi:cell wall-associated NlpC family hydrolase
MSTIFWNGGERRWHWPWGKVRRLLVIIAVSAIMSGCAGKPTRTVDAGGEAFDLSGLEPQRAEVVQAALAQIGTPYVYGGTTPYRALDCSGLMQVAHQAAGMSIPRVSTAQRAAARPLRGQPKAGDLVFFKTGPSQYHVGLMVDHKRFVHASTSKRRVRLARLGNPYWRERFLGAGSYL